MRKSTVIIFNQLNIKSNKNDKDNLKRKHKKNHMEKHCNNQRCFKEKKINCQPAQYEKNNFEKNIFGKKNRLEKHMGKHCSKAKIMWEKTVAIYSVLNNYKAKFSISLI
jgi:hypothetical protein